jgi:hypothetical protein
LRGQPDFRRQRRIYKDGKYQDANLHRAPRPVPNVLSTPSYVRLSVGIAESFCAM